MTKKIISGLIVRIYCLAGKFGLFLIFLGLRLKLVWVLLLTVITSALRQSKWGVIQGKTSKDSLKDDG